MYMYTAVHARVCLGSWSTRVNMLGRSLLRWSVCNAVDGAASVSTVCALCIEGVQSH